MLGEGISTLFAVPVMVRGDARGILYCGSWSQSPIGDLVTRPAFTVAGELGTELHVREEVQRRLAVMPPTPTTSTLGPAAREQLRESYAELRSIAATVEDPSVRARLTMIEKRLAVPVARRRRRPDQDGRAPLAARDRCTGLRGPR